jgi:hypothetical protein
MYPLSLNVAYNYSGQTLQTDKKYAKQKLEMQCHLFQRLQTVTSRSLTLTHNPSRAQVNGVSPCTHRYPGLMGTQGSALGWVILTDGADCGLVE